MSARLTRRAFGAVALLVFLGCSKTAGARCETCGMRLTPTDPFFAELVPSTGVAIGFDSPRCAFEGLARHAGASLWVHEYYDQVRRPASELRFVEHSDVIGPMGPDLIPVDPERVTRFVTGHGGGRISSFEETAARFVHTP